jgi:hypothetical protein
MRARFAAALALVLIVASLAACRSAIVARLLNPRSERCQASLHKAFSLMLVGQGEQPEIAEKMADDAIQALADVEMGARPFKLSAPSGYDYGFFFEREDNRCLLRLVAWQKGIVQYSDAVTYLATRPLPGCACES